MKLIACVLDKEKRKRAKCFSCKRRRLIDTRTDLCAECAENFRQVIEEHFDGDPLAPLKYAAEEMRQR